MQKQIKAQLLAMAFAASQLGFLVAGGLLGGLWADKKFDSSPIFAILGLLGGFGTGMRILVMLVKAQKKGQDHETGGSSP